MRKPGSADSSMSSLEEIKKVERKFFARCAIGIVIGLIPIAIGWNLKGLSSTILVIGGAIIILITLFYFSGNIELITKAKGLAREAETGEEYKETYIDWPQWIKKWGWLAFGFPMLFGVGWFGKMHENDFGGLKFLWHSLVAGILAGIAIFYLLKIRFPKWTDNKKKSSEIGFYIMLAAVFVIVCFGPIVNKYFANTSVICTEYRIKSTDKGYKKGNKYIHVFTENGSERFNPPYSFFGKLTTTDSFVILCTRKGALGYDYVEEFILPGK